MKLFYYEVSEWTYKHTPGEEKLLSLWSKRISTHTKHGVPLSLTCICSENPVDKKEPIGSVEYISDLEDYGLEDMHEGLITIPADDFMVLKETLAKASTADYLGVVINLKTETINLNDAEILEFSFDLTGRIGQQASAKEIAGPS